MKIYINIYSNYKIKILFKFKIKYKLKIFIIIKKNKLKYYLIKNILLYNIKNNLIINIHCCDNIMVKHSFKHLFKINHNSILENKLNVFF
ncbi:MAG: hypothetical protein ACH6QQ_00155 [Candidatus Carsonella ruddii]